MADSILNRVATDACRIDHNGPNMREHFAKRREPAAVPEVPTLGTANR